MWRHWMSVGAVVVGALAGWTQAAIMPVERRMDLKATADAEVDDPAEIAVGAVYGVHTAKAEKTVQRTFMMFPVAVSSTITVTSDVRPDLIKLDIHSVNVCTPDYDTPFYGQAEGWANITFDLTETTKFHVIAGQESRAEGGIGIPMTVWSTPVGGGEPVATDTVDWKLAYLGSSWWATDAIYELGPGRHMLSIGLTDMREAGTCPGGHLWVTMQAVPEPGIAGMLLVGAVGMMARRRR